MKVNGQSNTLALPSDVETLPDALSSITAEETKPKKSQKLSAATQQSLVKFVRNALVTKHAFTTFRNKLAAIDVAYSAYKAPIADRTNPDGVDVDFVKSTTDTTINVVASQVDTVVASLVETFLSGYPIFPVVSGPKTREVAEKFEAVLDDHSKKGRYMRHLVLAIKDAAKYDFVAMEHVWDTISPFNPQISSPFALLDSARIPLTRIRRLDPYNTIWDYSVPQAEVSAEGEYAGDIQMLTRSRLKRYLTKLSSEPASKSLNVAKAMGSSIKDIAKALTATNAASTRSYNFTQHPTINDYVSATDTNNGSTNWDAWFENAADMDTSQIDYTGMYEVVTLYARIIPSQHHMNLPKPNTEQIWKLVVVNATHLVEAHPIASPYDMLPVSIGQPMEDGLRYQTKSLSERSSPFQQAASDLYNIKINSSKRAINDRMFYDSRYVNQTDINTGVPAAKIPVQLGMNKSIKDVVQSIPFNDSATAGTLVDLQQTLQMANLVNGLNPFRQGQTIKGNRTKAEFAGVTDSSELRTRLLALMLEVQIFMPLKDTLKLNIILHNESITVVSDRNGGQEITLTPADVQSAILEFQIADGVRPKDKLMSTEDMQSALLFLAQNQQIGAEYNVGSLFIHLMSLRGVKGMEQYKYDAESKQAILAKALPLIQQMQADQGQPQGQ